MSVKIKKKQGGKKNYLGSKKDQNKFKNSGGSKGLKDDYFVCGNKTQSEANVVQAYDNMISIVRKIIVIKGNVQ